MTQITEDYVSFETAKLLKEKGFDENTPVNYFVGDDKPRGCVVGEMIYHKRLEEDTHLIPAPTLQMAMKWLREVHHCVICITPLTFYCGEIVSKWGYCIWADDNTEVDEESSPRHESYEEACEAAIKYCLEKLI